MQHFRSEINPVTGNREDYYWDDAEGKLIQRTRANVTKILEANKRQNNASIDQRFGNQMMHEVANIPLTVVTEWRKKYGIDVFKPEHKKKMLRLLDDPEYRYLKTTTKRLSR